jgi:uncharacterized protein YegJ (DUF2314 family)
MLWSAVYAFVTVAVAAFAWNWWVARNRPKVPPLEIDDDDPLMLAAIERARGTVDQLRTLHEAGTTRQAQVKIPFRTNGGEVEHLWAEVLELDDDTMKVRYLTPPVTHRGKLEREHEHPVSDLEDWAVFDTSGNIRGGFTQRAMFERARARWGGLPDPLAAQEARYVD